MRKLILLLTLTALCLFADDSVGGKWTYTMETPMGDVVVDFDLKLDGKAVTGTVAAGERSFPVQNGTYEDGVLKMSCTRDRPQGGTMVYKFEAKLDGAVLKGTTEADVDGEKVTQQWEAKRK
jgi:hypothetical protein